MCGDVKTVENFISKAPNVEHVLFCNFILFTKTEGFPLIFFGPNSAYGRRIIHSKRSNPTLFTFTCELSGQKDPWADVFLLSDIYIFFLKLIVFCHLNIHPNIFYNCFEKLLYILPNIRMTSRLSKHLGALFLKTFSDHQFNIFRPKKISHRK